MKDNFNKSSKILHANRQFEKQPDTPSPFHLGVQPSVAYHYDSTKGLIDAFQNPVGEKSYTYSRQSSPSISALESKINLLEEGNGTLVFSSGMAAISDTFIALLKKGDHIVASSRLFGNTLSFFRTLERMGFEVTYVDVSIRDSLKKGFKSNTAFFFFETISNPLTTIPDYEAIIELLKGREVISIVDNTITTPYGFNPKGHGFTLSMNSLSKLVSGQANVLGGSITDLGNYAVKNSKQVLEKYHSKENPLLVQIRKQGLRDQGGTLSPSAASLISQGMDTLALRLENHEKNALEVAKYLEQHPKVEKVNFPGLKSHPDYKIGMKYHATKGSLLSFSLKSSRFGQDHQNTALALKPVITLIDNFKLIIRSTHLGDLRTMSIPVGVTIFNELGLEGRSKLGIDEGLIRLSVGVEKLDDILIDLEESLALI